MAKASKKASGGNGIGGKAKSKSAAKLKTAKVVKTSPKMKKC